MGSRAQLAQELDTAVQRWRQEGKRVPQLPSEQEVCLALDRIGIQWEWADGAAGHRLVLRTRAFDGEPELMFCPDIYLPEYDTYVEVTTSGLSEENKQVKTTNTCVLSLKRYKAAEGRKHCDAYVILLYGPRFQRVTSKKTDQAGQCMHNLIRKRGAPKKRHRPSVAVLA